MQPSTSALTFHRPSQWGRLDRLDEVDVLVIGGGATGLGVALDAVSRGWRVALFEANDFAAGTSSRSTKLLHGGVRYLAQGHWPLVREALRERSTLLSLAPHLTQPLSFIIPSKSWVMGGVYRLGLAAYDALAGDRRLGSTDLLSAPRACEWVPGLNPADLRCAVRYWDAQFDDARFALALARTAADLGALLLNYCPVVGFLTEGGQVAGVQVSDRQTGQTRQIRSRCIVNASGVWVHEVQKLAGGDPDEKSSPHLRPSQGIHLVVDRHFFPGEHALLVPNTRDGRVLFAIPWLGKTLLGTTDTPCHGLPLEPQATDQEVDFILDEARRWLKVAPTRSDIRSMWAGLRPLVARGSSAGSTADQSREHTIWTSPDGLINVTGGKWTTYRVMAEQVIDHCRRSGRLADRPSATRRLNLHGHPGQSPAVRLSDSPGEWLYGSDLPELHALPGGGEVLWSESGAVCLTAAMVRYAVRREMACTVADVLARRCRLLLLDAKRAFELAPRVGDLMREELGPSFIAADSVAEAQAVAVQCQGLRPDCQ